MSKSSMCSYGPYDQFESESILSEQSSMSDNAQDMFGKSDEEVKHFSNIFPMEELESFLNLPACAFTDGTDVFQKYEKGSLESLWIDQNIDNLGFGTNNDFNNAVMGYGTANQLSELGSESYKREKGETFIPSLNSPETSIGNKSDSSHQKFASSTEDILSAEATNHSGIIGNQSDDFDQTEIILQADLRNKPSATGWIAEYQIKIEVENDSPELSHKTQDNIKVQTTADSEKLDAMEICCSVCTMPALKHSSYGGQVCSSCRSFFRRAAQSGYHALFQCKHGMTCQMDPETRKKCQFCRFQSCLRSGMKTTWVLSDQERKRRYGKLKTNVKAINSGSKQFVQSVTRPSVIVFSFTTEEKKNLESVCMKFQVPWLENFLMFDRVAGFNLIKYKLLFSEPQSQMSVYQIWVAFKQSMSLTFMRLILPRFEELSDLSSSDVGQLMNSSASGIAQFFRSCHMFNMGEKIQGKAESCPIASQVMAMSSNSDMMTRLDLQDLLSRLDLSGGVAVTRMVEYEELYPDGWAGDEEAERRHREAVSKIVNWPKDDDNKFDYQMAVLMSLILIFHADHYTLANRDRVENIQLKYTMILHRYLRFKLKTENANKKFLEAMLLIEETRQAWQISYWYRRME